MMTHAPDGQTPFPALDVVSEHATHVWRPLPTYDVAITTWLRPDNGKRVFAVWQASEEGRCGTYAEARELARRVIADRSYVRRLAVYDLDTGVMRIVRAF